MNKDLILIDDKNYIGDDVNLLNNNYQTLNEWTQSIEMSAASYWKPLMDLFTGAITDQDPTAGSLWKSAFDTALTKNSTWRAAFTTVSQYSAVWIKPMSILFPGILGATTEKNSNIVQIGAWLNVHFPPSYTINITEDTTKSVVQYFEGQEIYVYSFRREPESTITKTETVNAQTVCTTFDGTMWSNCTVKYSGTANCPDGPFSCDNNSMYCEQSAPITCNYASPPDGPYYLAKATVIEEVITDPGILIDEDYSKISLPFNVSKQTWYTDNTKLAISLIQARLKIKFTNTREKLLLPVYKFKVQNCSWIFDKVLQPNTDPTFRDRTYVDAISVEIVQLTSETKRKFYTNSDGKFIFKFKGNAGNTYEINMNGKSMLHSITDSNTPIQIEFSNLNAQTYVLTIYNKNSQAIKVLNVAIEYDDAASFVTYYGPNGPIIKKNVNDIFDLTTMY